MSKKVIWSDEIKMGKKAEGTYSSFSEFIQKANSYRAEQDEAIDFLQKSFPALLTVLEFRLKKGAPLTVMRPLRYKTSDIAAEEDDGFYNVRKSGASQFIDVIKTINPGTVLVLKSLDAAMREFIFVDPTGKEHCISYDEKNVILTQTDIFEETREHLRSQNSR